MKVPENRLPTKITRCAPRIDPDEEKRGGAPTTS